jgi:GT2 family glycosyltransferase
MASRLNAASGELDNAREQMRGNSEELRQLRAERDSMHRTREILGKSLKRVFGSWSWRIAAPLRFIARSLGLLNIGSDQLQSITDARQGADGCWEGTGPAQLMVPIFPMKGWARVRARIVTSTASRAVLYFDTGSSFNSGESFSLGDVSGQTKIDQLVPMRQWTYCLRFDPIQDPGRFEIRDFRFEPISRLRVNLGALMANVRKALLAPREKRPSIKLGLRLLARGEWRKFHRQLMMNAETSAFEGDYNLWVKKHAISRAERQQMAKAVAGWKDPPKISVVVPVYNVAESYLRRCIEGVLKQIYPHWELCIADDGSTQPHIKRVLDEYAARDQRIKVVYRSANGNISAASNSALELATGQYAALLDHDDEIAEHALFRVAEAIVNDPSLDMIYSDEDKLSPDGIRHDPFFKPDWSPEYFLACMYTCHLGVYRTEMVRAVGGWRSDFDGAQDYDLVLRIIERNPRIHHIPDVLYHWRTLPSSTASGPAAKPHAYQRAREALESHLQRMGRHGHVEAGPSEGFHRIRYDIVANPRVTIVVPTACRSDELSGNQTWFVLQCVSSIRRLSTYPNFEIIVLDNGDMPDDLAEALKPLDIRLMSFTGQFNLSRKLNLGAFAAKGEQLILLNDDVEVLTPDWIESMLEYSQWNDVGAVGAQLLFPNDTQQHNGVTVLNGNPGHPFYQFPKDHPGYYFSSQVHRNWSAVTGACMMTRAQVFREIGGFSEQFPLNYNDVDYCLKLLSRGMRIVYTPYAKLYHHEAASKLGLEPRELAAFKKAWQTRFPRDPYYNPNLTNHACDFRIA